METEFWELFFTVFCLLHPPKKKRKIEISVWFWLENWLSILKQNAMKELVIVEKLSSNLNLAKFGGFLTAKSVL